MPGETSTAYGEVDPMDADTNSLGEQEPSDSLPEWLFQRFGSDAPFKSPAARAEWADLPEDDRAYWAHEADAVRRAVARNGFKGGRE